MEKKGGYKEIRRKRRRRRRGKRKRRRRRRRRNNRRIERQRVKEEQIGVLFLLFLRRKTCFQARGKEVKA